MLPSLGECPRRRARPAPAVAGSRPPIRLCAGHRSRGSCRRPTARLVTLDGVAARSRAVAAPEITHVRVSAATGETAAGRARRRQARATAPHKAPPIALRTIAQKTTAAGRRPPGHRAAHPPDRDEAAGLRALLKSRPAPGSRAAATSRPPSPDATAAGHGPMMRPPRRRYATPHRGCAKDPGNPDLAQQRHFPAAAVDGRPAQPRRPRADTAGELRAMRTPGRANEGLLCGLAPGTAERAAARRLSPVVCCDCPVTGRWYRTRRSAGPRPAAAGCAAPRRYRSAT